MKINAKFIKQRIRNKISYQSKLNFCDNIADLKKFEGRLICDYTAISNDSSIRPETTKY